MLVFVTYDWYVLQMPKKEQLSMQEKVDAKSYCFLSTICCTG